MSLKITHKYSTAAGTPPASGDIDVGEIAINAADAELYTKDNAGAVHAFKSSFTQSGAGAVTRTIESKLQDVVSVKDFGAVGDGVADDTAAIQAALNRNPVKPVFFPAGIYRLTDQLTCSVPSPGSLSLQGEGIGTSILRWDNPGGITVNSSTSGDSSSSVNSVVVSDLTFSANCLNCGTALFINGPQASQQNTMAGAIIQNCDFRAWTRGTGQWNYGTVVTANINGTILNCTYDNFANSGIHIYGTYPSAPTDWVISGCELFFALQTNILIEGDVEGVHVTDCTCIAAPTAIKWSTSLGNSRPWLRCTGNHILGNTGLDIDGVHEGIVTGNLFYTGTTADPVYCIKLSNTQHGTLPARDPERWVIANNIFKATNSAAAPTEYAIYATELTYSTISNNILSLFEVGISLGANTSRCQVLGNKDVGCAQLLSDTGTLNSAIELKENNTLLLPSGSCNIGSGLDPYNVPIGSSLKNKTLQIASNENQSLCDHFKNGQTGYFSTFWYSPNTSDSAQSAGTRIGWIDTTTGSTVNYASASDYRLKTDIKKFDTQRGLAIVEALSPVQFKWKHTGEVSDGFIAHEVQQVVPEAVSGRKDEVDNDGRIVPQGLDVRHLTPAIVAAIQDLSRRLREAGL